MKSGVKEMMNEKVKRLSYKFYLSAQGLVLIIASIAFIWIFVAAIHDIYISQKGKQCVDDTLGSWVINDNQGSDSNWARAIDRYAEKFDHPSKKYALKELLGRKCSNFLHVTIYDYSGELSVYTNNYTGSYPATYSERFGYLGVLIGIASLFLGLFYGLMKWLSWLSKDQ
jgi:hypothetical protein